MRKAIVFLAAIIILSILGSALAMWYDILKIRTTVETGEVDVEFDGPIYVQEVSERDGKDVASCSAEFIEVEDEDLNNPFGNNDLELKITVDNAYPCYICKVNSVNVINTGTIPVKVSIARIEAYPTGHPDQARVCTLMYNPDYGDYFECDVDGDGDADINLWGCFTGFLEDIQLHPGEYKSFTVELHVKQGAEEDSSFTVQIYLMARQWNEELSPQGRA